MSRFAEPPHDSFRRLNDSIGFDWRLGPYDVEQSRAHASMLAAQGIISEQDRDELHRGLDQVRHELSDGSFSFAIRPDRNTRYRALAADALSAPSAPVVVAVRERLRFRIARLPLGRVRVSIVARHPRDLRWGRRGGRWYVGRREVARGRSRAIARTARKREKG